MKQNTWRGTYSTDFYDSSSASILSIIFDITTDDFKGKSHPKTKMSPF